MIPPAEETLVPNSAMAWKSLPLLPVDARPTLSVSPTMSASLHSMGVLQAYQADRLEELDKGDGITPEAVKELRRATDLALRATKLTA